MTKEQFVQVLKDIGLSSSQMENFHKILEERHPDAHQEFLEWLNIPVNEIAQIRNASR